MLEIYSLVDSILPAQLQQPVVFYVGLYAKPLLRLYDYIN